MEALKLYWLGTPVVEIKGRTVKLETRKAAAMLAYLSLSSGNCSRELLATMFWPEGSQQKALANLRRTLSSLNSSLPGWIEADRGTISLKRNAKLWVDVDAFHQLLSQLEEHGHAPTEVCDACLSILVRAVEVDRGEFLEGLNLGDSRSFDEWQFFQRDGLHQKFADVLQRLSSGYSERGQWDRAIDYARRWAALDRLHEPACRALMDLYARSGQRAAALRQYEDLARLLNEQMGQQPEQETLRLYEQIRGQEEAQEVVESPKGFASFPLLKTKLYIPTTRISRVFRSHLIARLGEVERKALTIISAPAGFGKTTLLEEWITQTSLPVAWLSLDTGDNDLFRFISYLIAALESIHENVGLEARQIMQSSQLATPNVILSSLMNDLGTVADPYVLVLDDYQFITEYAVNEAVVYLLGHLPPCMHLIISTRADPPLQLGRLRAHDQLLELRTRDLRFTPEEATEFLNAVMRLELSIKDIETLETRTEGWVVGLKMAALSLKGNPNRTQFINTFGGSHRYILDYLLEEVLNAQSEEINSFLLFTSILGQLNGALCNAITGRTDSYQILEKLEKENLFVTALDDERLWYRYHHLFADLLSNRLSQYCSSTDIKEFHRRACYWFAQNDLNDKAMHHALIAGEYDFAVNIIEKNALQMIGKGETITLMSWIANLPDELVKERLLLLRFKIWGFGFAGKIDQAELLFPRIEEILDSQTQSKETQAIRGEIALFRGVAANYRCQFQEASDQCQTALALIPEASTRIRTVAVFALGDIYRAQGDLLRSSRAFVEAGCMAHEFGEFWTQVQSLWSQAIVSEIQGKLHEAESLYQRAYAIAAERGLQPGSVVMVDVGMSGLYYQWNKLEQVWQLLSGGAENISWPGTMRWWETPNMLAPGYLILARLLKNSGEQKAAKAATEKAVHLCEEFDVFPDIYSQVRAELVRSWLEQGEMAKAAEWLKHYQLKKNKTLEVWHECEDMASIRVLLALGKFAEAQNLLARLTESAEDGNRIKHLIEMLVLQTLALHATKNHFAALDILQKALTLSQPEAYVRIFLDEGEVIIKLLHRLKDSKLAPGLKGYINRLLEARTPS